MNTPAARASMKRRLPIHAHKRGQKTVGWRTKASLWVGFATYPATTLKPIPAFHFAENDIDPVLKAHYCAVLDLLCVALVLSKEVGDSLPRLLRRAMKERIKHDIAAARARKLKRRRA